MKKFTNESGIVLPLNRANVDTDFILDKGEPDADNSGRPLNPDFVMNQPRYAGAKVLLARDNFGCGSSREHAPWALDDYGFRAIIAPSFADIFFNNCFKNGLLPIVLDKEVVDGLFAEVEACEGYALEIDLESQQVRKPDGTALAFEVDAFRKHCLLNGLDDIGLTLEDSNKIAQFETSWREKSPWYFTLSH